MLPFLKFFFQKHGLINHLIDGSCSLPSTWDGKWYDSGLGDIIFSLSSHNVQGWAMTVHGQAVTSWTCQTQKNTDNLLLFKWVKGTFLFSKLRIKYFSLWKFKKTKQNLLFSHLNYGVAEIIVFVVLYYRSDQIIEVNGVIKNVFRCIKWTNITDNSYHYYVLNGNTRLVELLTLICI